MNKLAHILILAVFAFACLHLWGILTMIPSFNRGAALPAFTLFCIALRPVTVGLPVLAAIYCVWVCCRPAARTPAWMPFFAVTMSTLVVTALPIFIAAYLPLVSILNQLSRK